MIRRSGGPGVRDRRLRLLASTTGHHVSECAKETLTAPTFVPGRPVVLTPSLMPMRPRSVLPVLTLLTVLAVSSGCGSVATAFGPVGSLYTNASGPVAVTSNASGSKVGRATASMILGIATGDASIQAAMADGGITRVHHVDYETNLILGLFGSYTCIVYGE